MKLQSLPVSMSLAAIVGAFHTYLIIWAWAYIVVYTPLPEWLISQGVTGPSFKISLFPADLLTNMLLSIPAAYVLCKLRPAKLWVYLLVALLPGFLWQYHLVLGDFALIQNWQIYLPGAALALLPLPATALLIQRFIAGPPNKGFNRTPESSGPAKPGELSGGAG